MYLIVLQILSIEYIIKYRVTLLSIGTDTLFHCEFRILYKKEAKLIAVHKAAYFKVPKGVMLGPGPFIEALESATGKKALFVGKPEPTFFCSVIKDLNSNAMETVMIGDVCKCMCVCVCLILYTYSRMYISVCTKQFINIHICYCHDLTLFVL